MTEHDETPIDPGRTDRASTRPGEPSARVVSLTATIEEILTNPRLTSQQLANRWQRVVRIAEEARDENVLDAASPDLETTLAECQLVTQDLSEVIWAAQHVIAVHGRLPEAHRLSLSTAAASLIDWMVAEFPTNPKDTWVLDVRDL